MDGSRTATSAAPEDALSARMNPFATPGAESHDNPFATPAIATPIAESVASRRLTQTRNTSSFEVTGPRRRFKSSRLIGDFEKPWLENKPKGFKHWNWDSIIFYIFIFIGLAVGGFLCYRETIVVPKHEYCLVMDETFKDLSNWNHEVQMNGFGNNAFDWTTDDASNSYVDAQGLHIVPTTTLETTSITEEQLLNGFTVNMTTNSKTWGTCTAEDIKKNNDRWPCAARSNATLGQIINPVRSARLNTKGKKTIKYGRVEVTARMPRGDWLWPAIWMMPQDEVYGGWPKSGEIDIAESRGNDAKTYPMGNNLVSSALHWGTAVQNDRWRRAYGEWGGKRNIYSDNFHVFGLEWSEKYLFTWLDGRLRQVQFFDFTKNKNLWTYGEFAGESINGSIPVDPWSSTGRKNSPFDESFYLILNVAVGGTNGWFPDAIGGKPWADSSETPMSDFWKANDIWLPTWGPVEDRGMIVKSVKMWQEGAC
ncbi:beta-1,3-glucan binding protein [Fusarium heterosporum]|uniref:Beta-1,3-glucan binding protein n=1 Tax=Fusarium heterosporum TaxID=42747 RepID=A0A8H5T883_FUSHE|nr:beta-1,3-glucan binding protein [Fusarium heterosporum]